MRFKSATVRVAWAMAVMAAKAHVDIQYTVTELGQLAAGKDSGAIMINDTGVIVGIGQNASVADRAVKFDGLGRVIDLNDLFDLLSGRQLEDGNGINNLGHIVSC